MGKTINKIKMSLSTLWIAIISFSSKVMGEHPYWVNSPAQPDYGIPTELLTSPKSESIIAIKIAQVLFVTIIFIVGIIILIKMRKIDNKTKGQKIIKWSTITILLILTVAILISIAAKFGLF